MIRTHEDGERDN
jgi:hypothetical protein